MYNIIYYIAISYVKYYTYVSQSLLEYHQSFSVP
jgi:hypothetical protein